MHRKGFTLMEILIVVAIIAMLVVSVLVSVQNQRDKAEDARVKSDLARLKIAFEDYYGDYNCYPPATWFDSTADCNSNALSPYLKEIPCDPNTNIPYKIEYVGSQCSGYRLYAKLQNTNDPGIISLCASSGGSTLGNYGVSSGNTTVQIDCTAFMGSPAGSAAPLPSTNPGPYACGPDCHSFASHAAAVAAGCPITFSDSSCDGGSLCSNPAYQCP